MVKAITKKSSDHSDSGNFSFSFYCDKCGREWTSEVTAFTGMDSTAVNNEEARQLLWANEHRVAFEAANFEARLHFSRCPICGKWVCDYCFCIEEKKHGGVCRECNENEEYATKSQI
jgi:hypothetical protein